MLTSPHTCTLTDGIVQFCEDAGVDLAEQVEGLVLLWALGQEEQLTLTKNQFVKGMAALNCTTAADIKKAMPSIVSRAYGSDFKCKCRGGWWLLVVVHVSIMSSHASPSSRLGTSILQVRIQDHDTKGPQELV